MPRRLTIAKVPNALSGVGALGLLMFIYWLPRCSPQTEAKRAFGLTLASLGFVVLTCVIGGLYAKAALS